MKADELKTASSKVSKSVQELKKRAEFVILSAKPIPGEGKRVSVDKDAFRKMNSALKMYDSAMEEFGLFVKEHVKA